MGAEVAPVDRPLGATPATGTAAAGASASGHRRQAALDAVVDGLGPVYAVSPFAPAGGVDLVAVDHDVAVSTGGSQVTVDVYAWDGAVLVRRAVVPLDQDGSVGVLLPASGDATPITVASLTGAGAPDFAVTTASASALLTTIVSDVAGGWRPVPFATPAGPALAVPSAHIDGPTVTSPLPTCAPSCAQGGGRSEAFTYQAGEMVPGP